MQFTEIQCRFYCSTAIKYTKANIIWDDRVLESDHMGILHMVNKVNRNDKPFEDNKILTAHKITCKARGEIDIHS